MGFLIIILLVLILLAILFPGTMRFVIITAISAILFFFTKSRAVVLQPDSRQCIGSVSLCHIGLARQNGVFLWASISRSVATDHQNDG